MIKLGYAQCDITPTAPMTLVGFSRENEPFRGILKPLAAQAAVFEDENGRKAALITIDSLGFMKVLSDSLRDRIAALLGADRSHVMICFSHTHSAPNAADSGTGYYDMVCRNILAAVREAADRMADVRIGCANADAELGVNRRGADRDLDGRIGICTICEPSSDKPTLLILRVTAHCNSLKRDNYCVSPDYFGDIRELVGNEYGCPVMVIQGAAGNVAPKYYRSEIIPIDGAGEEYVRSDTALSDMAQEVLMQIAAPLERIVPDENTELDVYSRELTLFSDVPDEETAERTVREADEYCGIDGTAWLGEVRRLRAEHIERQSDVVEVQYFRLGKWCLCGVPYEIMNEFALRASAALGDPYFYLNGYTNGCLSYFPTEEEFDEGGYEVYWSLLIYYAYFDRVFPFERASAGRLVDFVVEKNK